jgi:hypothetical protein
MKFFFSTAQIENKNPYWSNLLVEKIRKNRNPSFDLMSSLNFIYFEKATKFCEISTIDLSYVVPVKSTVENVPKKVTNFLVLILD